jgi:hypothetical protein
LRHEDIERLSRKERYEYFTAWARRAVDAALPGKVTKVDILAALVLVGVSVAAVGIALDALLGRLDEHHRDLRCP